MGEFWPTTAEGWLSLLLKFGGIVVPITLFLWRVSHKHIEKKFADVVNDFDEKVVKECKERKLADSRIEEKLRTNNDDVHVVAGKIEMMDLRIQELDRKRIEDSYELKMTLQQGLHEVKIELQKLQAK